MFHVGVVYCTWFSSVGYVCFRTFNNKLLHKKKSEGCPLTCSEGRTGRRTTALWIHTSLACTPPSSSGYGNSNSGGEGGNRDERNGGGMLKDQISKQINTFISDTYQSILSLGNCTSALKSIIVSQHLHLQTFLLKVPHGSTPTTAECAILIFFFR